MVTSTLSSASQAKKVPCPQLGSSKKTQVASRWSSTNTASSTAAWALFAQKKTLWESSWWKQAMIYGWIMLGGAGFPGIIRLKMSALGPTSNIIAIILSSRGQKWRNLIYRLFGITSWKLLEKNGSLILGILKETLSFLQQLQKTQNFSRSIWKFL